MLHTRHVFYVQWILLLAISYTLGCGEIQAPGCPGDTHFLEGVCVACLKDEHCRSSDQSDSTKICSKDNKCICGSDKDCPERQFCGLEGGCFECLQDTHCAGGDKPKCVQNFCQVCAPGDTKACTLPNVCGEGISVCESRGEWSDCKVPDSGFCKSGEVCVNKRCTTCLASQPLLCGDVCVNIATDANHCGACQKACKPGQLCSGERCVCQPGQLLCDGKCIDPTNNPAHCGACGRACTSGQTCASGACLQTCPKSTPTPCYGGCVDTNRDANHCGKCGSKCSGRKRCVSGTCRCPEGMTDCDGTCVDLEIDHQYCGSCSQACKRGQLCARGGCVTSCPASTPTTCYGGCVDLQNHPRHCGKCGKTCFDGQLCKAGKCVCPKGQSLCENQCVNVDENLLHCGGCGQACKDGESCYKGACIALCPDNTTLCDGGCVESDTSFHHCGGCGKTCRVTEQCKAGKCACADGYTLCGDDCVDTDNDAKHCGACDVACRVDEICRDGVCESVGTTCREGELRQCYTGARGTKGVGPCKGGVRTCQGGAFGACVGEVLPKQELCNDLDDDCDGRVDEDLYCISLVAGAGKPGYKEGPALQAMFDGPNGLIVSKSGLLYIADSKNHCIRVFDPKSQNVSLFAGACGQKGDKDGPAKSALFHRPEGLRFDASGNLYIADVNNGKIRKIDPKGVVTTVAGSGLCDNKTDKVCHRDGPVGQARFYNAFGLALDAQGNIYVADGANHVIRKIDQKAGVVTTFAGIPNGKDMVNGPGAKAKFHWPSRLDVDGQGNVYVGDASNRQIRKIDPKGNVTTFAGSVWGSSDTTPMTASRFKQPCGVVVDANGDMYVADGTGMKIRKLLVKQDRVTTVAGFDGAAIPFQAGPGVNAYIGSIFAIAIDNQNKRLYLTSTNTHQIYQIKLD
ncbi:MAG: hypothetical protein CL932_04535 [Deltaproteobacteria bacterium]|nr:hypothetical protein [Deltaproteobacteria bacterium]